MSHLDDLKILSLQKSRDQFIDLLAWNHLWVHEEKLKVDRLMTVLVDEEVPVCFEELRDLQRFQLSDEAILELNMYRRRELFRLTCTIDSGHVLTWHQMVESARTSRIHHHLVQLSLRIWSIYHDGLVFEVFRVCLLYTSPSPRDS